MAITVVSIPSLPEATIANDGDYLIISQSGVTKKIKKSNVVNTSDNINIIITPGNSYTIMLSSQALIAVNVSDLGIGADENFKLKIGTTEGGSDIADLELAVSDTHGFRQGLSFSTARTQTIYITEYSAGGTGAIQVCLETKKIYQ